MIVPTDTRCSDCGYENAPDAPVCGLCGVLREVPAGSDDDAGQARNAPPIAPVKEERFPLDFENDQRGFAGAPHESLDEDGESWTVPWLFVAAGAMLAPFLSTLPIVDYMGWFFSSLCHEIGHTVVAWAFGMPAYPAIRLDGHAAAIHREQMTLLVLLAWAGLAFAAWHFRRHRRRVIAFAVAALVYPALAWTDARELLHLVGGHVGELVFATVFVWRALDGGFSKYAAERVLYAVIGLHLVFTNLVLGFSLVTSAAARARYQQSGSFGLTNDYVRIADDVLGCSLPAVAGVMLAVATLPVLVAAWLWWRGRD